MTVDTVVVVVVADDDDDVDDSHSKNDSSSNGDEGMMMMMVAVDLSSCGDGGGTIQSLSPVLVRSFARSLVVVVMPDKLELVSVRDSPNHNQRPFGIYR